MGCVAAKVNLRIYERGTFDKTFQWKTGDPAVAVDLTGYTAEFTVRSALTDATVLISATEASVPWEADGDSGVYLDDGAEGFYRLYLNDVDTQGICIDNEDVVGVYDLFLYSAAGEAVLKQYGKCTLVAAVARA